jgi:ribosome-associated protein
MTDLSKQFAFSTTLATSAQDLQPVAVTSPLDQTDSSYQLAIQVAAAAAERKGSDIVLIRVGEVSVLADYFVLVTGFSKVQVRAISNSITDQVEEVCDRLPLRSEGMGEGTWIALDYGVVIAHVFMPQEREYYDLEAFWGHAERIPYEVEPSPSISPVSEYNFPKLD